MDIPDVPDQPSGAEGAIYDALGLLKEAIVQDLSQTLRNRFRSLDSHAGAFEADEARRFVLPSPALRIAVTSWRGVIGDGDDSTLVQAQLVLSILARDESALRRRDVVALELAQAVTRRLLVGSYLNPAQLGSRIRSPRAHEVSAKVLYDGNTDRSGFAMWIIEAPYVVDLSAPAEHSALELKDLWLGQHPKVGPLHVRDYQQVASSSNIQ